MSAEPGDPELRDDQLVSRARAGDSGALDRLVARHHAVAYRLALGYTRDPDLAADATQNAFLKALAALDRFRGDARFRTWLLSIVMNESRTLMRRAGRRRESSLDDVAPIREPAIPVDEAVVRRQEEGRARELVGRLPEKQRLAVTLRVDEGLSFREVGELIGSSEGAARVNYHHGIRKLREWMDDA
ncbi:MAG: sigma-70 family RNA polymerase sigma factor [Gemmatimonadota bacterium]